MTITVSTTRSRSKVRKPSTSKGRTGANASQSSEVIPCRGSQSLLDCSRGSSTVTRINWMNAALSTRSRASLAPTISLADRH